MNLFAQFFIVLILLSGCSSIKPISHKIDSNPDHVDLNLQGSDVQSNDAKTELIEIIPPEETVRLGDRGGDTYQTSDGAGIAQEAKKMRIGLSLGPGLYRTLNYVALLKSLEKHGLAPAIITGTGLGAIVAAMYASGMTPEVIEWNFFRYFREKGNHRPYEEEWYEDIDQLLLTKFKDKTLRDMNKKFYITLYDSKAKKTYYFNEGNLRNLLLLNLRLSGNTNRSKIKSKYTTAFESEVFNPNLMRRVGADFVIGADVLGAKIDLEDSNEYLVGIYGRVIGRVAKEKKNFDYFYSIPAAGAGLDSIDDRASFLVKTEEYVEKQVGTIKKLIQLKAEPVSEL